VHCGGWMKLSYRSALLPIMAVLFAFGLQSAHLPAAWLFGPLVASALFAAAMSDSLRADSRLVVIMQYTRLLLILASLALVTPFLSHHSSSIRVPEAPALLLATFAWWKIGTLCLLAFIGWLTGLRTRIPAGTFLVPTGFFATDRGRMHRPRLVNGRVGSHRHCDDQKETKDA